jgi:hypothetical protein
MQQLPLDGLYGTRLAIDLCRVCRAGSTAASTCSWRRARSCSCSRSSDANGARTPLPSRLPCPRCGLRLLLTDDRQRATRFRYWRCARDHGRYITFVDFLREKDFVRELDPAQLAELKAQVRSVACSSCGAPIDLARDTVCSHCHTPLAMLDVEQVGRGDALRRRRPAAHRIRRRPRRSVSRSGTSASRARLPSARDAALGTLNASGGLIEGGLSEVVADPAPAVVMRNHRLPDAQILACTALRHRPALRLCCSRAFNAA